MSRGCECTKIAFRSGFNSSFIVHISSFKKMAVLTSPIALGSSAARGSWRDLDWVMLAVIALLAIWGCMTIRSATLPRDETVVARVATAVSEAETGQAGTPAPRAKSKDRIPDVAKQVVWVVIGLALLVGLALSNYQWLMHFQFGLYLANLFLLGAVLVLPRSLAPVVNGAKSWIRLGPFALQPAEFCKFALIVALAAFLARRQEKIREFPTLLLSLFYIAPPLFLILKQPDFGSMLAVLTIWLGMMYFGGAKLWHLGAVVFVGFAMFTSAWVISDGITIRGHLYKKPILKAHQKARLAVFMVSNPSSAVDKAAGYQIKQSQIAIGSGQITGQGYGRGMQNRSGYVPENNTDFIFTVVAEEWGFIGAAALLALYFVLLVRCASVATATDNYFGVLIAGGFTALLAFHTIENLGMTMRLMPITGVPLPFFSYGGSSFLAFSCCAGLLQSIAMRGKRAVY
jgi:rod shape determining protein RodA